MHTNYSNRTSEKGNVLFLILIAVALFAALSYVVTQSTRSGGGSTEREQNILSSAQMTQYPTALRTALIRMILSGVPIERIAFNTPGTFSSGLSDNFYVFHPAGGGAVYQESAASIMVNNLPQQWTFNAEFEVPGIGIEGVGGNDVIAFLSGITPGICKQVNDQLGINTSSCSDAQLSAGVPIAASAVTQALIDDEMDHAYTFPTGNAPDIDGTCTGVFTRKASGCFAVGSSYTFYSVLLER